MSGTIPLKHKKILITHFRVGKTDGVSLEIESWKEILKRAGAKVALCSGPVSSNSDFIIENLEQQLNPRIWRIDEDAFGGLKHFVYTKTLQEAIDEERERLKVDFEYVIEEFRPDYLIVSNIFSVGEGIHAAPAITEVLDKYKIPTIAVNHDFTWENKRYSKPTSLFIRNLLEDYFPPKRDYLFHFCINSIGQKALLKRRGIKSKILYDTFDFRQEPWEKNRGTTSFLKKFGVDKNDIVFLQATRIVRRKNIELAIDLISTIKKSAKFPNLSKKNLAVKKRFNPKRNKLVLILSGYVEKRDRKYLDKLIEYAKEKKVNLIYLGKELDKAYKLWDIYPYADIVTFPSEYEGFGNQLLEAFFARKPIVLFEYPVWLSDIKPKGFKVISLGTKLLDSKNGPKRIPQTRMKEASEKVLKILTSKSSYSKSTKKNFKLGKKFFSLSRRLKDFNSSVYNKSVSHNFNLGLDNFSYQKAFEVFAEVIK